MDAGLFDMQYEPVEVECYSGYMVNERPTAFTCQGRRREVAEIIDRWYEGGLDATRPAVNYYKVKTAGGSTFILRYLSLFNAWSGCSIEDAGKGGD